LRYCTGAIADGRVLVLVIDQPFKLRCKGFSIRLRMFGWRARTINGSMDRSAMVQGPSSGPWFELRCLHLSTYVQPCQLGAPREHPVRFARPARQQTSGLGRHLVRRHAIMQRSVVVEGWMHP